MKLNAFLTPAPDGVERRQLYYPASAKMADTTVCQDVVPLVGNEIMSSSP
jgi:hypothetical protein